MGVVLECRARIQACPYGKEMHAETKEELYPIALAITKTVPPSEGLASTVKLFGAPRTWSSMSRELETSPAPVELIIASLGQEIQRVKTDYWKHGDGTDPGWVLDAEKQAKWIAYECLTHDIEIPDYIHPDIAKETKSRYIKAGGPSDRSGYNILATKMQQHEREIYLAKLFRENPPPRNAAERKAALEPMIKEFNHYSAILNMSKIISKRHFINHSELTDFVRNNNPKAIEEKISKMDDIELLTTYDQYTIDDAYVSKMMHDINGFGYDVRNDLSEKANLNLLRWHNRAAEVSKNYTLQSAPRILLAIKLHQEIQNRNIQGGDLTIDNINIDDAPTRSTEKHIRSGDQPYAALQEKIDAGDPDINQVKRNIKLGY